MVAIVAIAATAGNAYSLATAGSWIGAALAVVSTVVLLGEARAHRGRNAELSRALVTVALGVQMAWLAAALIAEDRAECRAKLVDLAERRE